MKYRVLDNRFRSGLRFDSRITKRSRFETEFLPREIKPSGTAVAIWVAAINCTLDSCFRTLLTALRLKIDIFHEFVVSEAVR